MGFVQFSKLSVICSWAGLLSDSTFFKIFEQYQCTSLSIWGLLQFSKISVICTWAGLLLGAGPEQFVACLTAPALGPYARPGKAALTAASALLAAKKQEGSLQMRMDPRWFYTPSNPEQAQTALAELRCHVTLLRSACSQWISEDAVRGAASMACNAASWNVVPVPGVLGYPASEVLLFTPLVWLTKPPRSLI